MGSTIKAIVQTDVRVVASVAFAMLLAIEGAHASVTISANPTANMSCSAGVCSPTAKKAVLNVHDLIGMLANQDVKITTGNGAVTISVFAPFSWTSAHRLTLDAYYNITVQAPVTVAGGGAVTIVTHDGGTGGDLIFFPGGSLDFWDLSSGLTIDGATYQLVGDIGSLSAAIASNHAGAFALANNYDASVDGLYKKDPVHAPFAGRFEGLGHQISNLTIKNYSQDASIGFFPRLESTAVVRDFALDKLKIVTGNTPYYIGGIAGYVDGAALIVGCSVDGTFRIFGNGPDTGGLVGYNFYGTISRSNAAVDFTYKVNNGGVIGEIAGINYGSIDHSSATGSITGVGFDGLIGGLVAWDDGQISYSHASVAISVADLEVGGLVGEANGSIDSSYATGAVVQTQTTSADCVIAVGGLVGNDRGARISNAYATGSVTADEGNCIGGLFGFYYKRPHEVVLSNAYATGHLSGVAAIGGFMGSGNPGLSIAGGYWDITTTGAQDPAAHRKQVNGVTGLSDAQLKSALPAGFDPAIWGQKKNINNGYPYLLANPPPQ